MTHEERTAFRMKLEHKSADLLERLERFCAESSGLTLMQIGEVSDALKDLAEVEEKLAKAYHYESKNPYHDDKKY